MASGFGEGSIKVKIYAMLLEFSESMNNAALLMIDKCFPNYFGTVPFSHKPVYLLECTLKNPSSPYGGLWRWKGYGKQTWYLCSHRENIQGILQSSISRGDWMLLYSVVTILKLLAHRSTPAPSSEPKRLSSPIHLLL